MNDISSTALKRVILKLASHKNSWLSIDLSVKKYGVNSIIASWGKNRPLQQEILRIFNNAGYSLRGIKSTDDINSMVDRLVNNISHPERADLNNEITNSFFANAFDRQLDYTEAFNVEQSMAVLSDLPQDPLGRVMVWIQYRNRHNC